MTKSTEITILDEPRLQFAKGRIAIDPHDGLILYGPYSLETPAHPSHSQYIALGTQQGLEKWYHWASLMNKPIHNPELNPRLWSPYPGFEVAFGTKWAASPARSYEIDHSTLLKNANKKDKHERSYSVVNQILESMDKSLKLDSKPVVAICVIPDEIWSNCRPESMVVNPSDKGVSTKIKLQRKAGQQNLFEKYDIEQYSLAPDFRRQIKARVMKFGIPIQIIRESTLNPHESSGLGERGLTPLSDRMWNIGTSLYYKGGGKPWKLADAREGVCYIGIAFRRVPEDKKTACCAAQMFLDSGDGIVFLGEYGPWYSSKTKQFHLEPKAAEKLLRGALNTYESLKSPGSPKLKEIFLHSRSSISNAEFSGYQKACPKNCKIIGIRVRRSRYGPRLFRNGTMPVIRGTLWKMDNKNAHLYCSGFKPRLASYDGSETPAPLEISIQHGDADIEAVAKDILSLTKLNYNACRFGDSEPVTVLFSDAVGEILISNPTVTARSPNFKFYI